jgi:hypothetical protein
MNKTDLLRGSNYKILLASSIPNGILSGNIFVHFTWLGKKRTCTPNFQKENALKCTNWPLSYD